MSDEFNEFLTSGEPIKIINVSSDAPLLAGHDAPYHLNKKERPIHRAMVELAGKGYDNKEIAQMVGRTQVNVNNALRQPHSQQNLVNEIRRKVSEDERVVMVIKDNVENAVKALAEIVRGGDGIKSSDRIAAAEALLNRRYGKPNTPINRGTDVDLNKLSDADLAALIPSTDGTGTSS